MRAMPALALLALLPSGAPAMVMNANPDRLPPGCDEVAERREITVHAGKAHAEPFPGKVFTYDRRVLRVPRCTRLTVTFVNQDHIRHQWMVHGLPRETYPGGMFTLEVDGPGRATGTLILPGERRTLMVHCGLPQHMQKGMKGEIRIAGGDRRAANIPGVTGDWREPEYGRWARWGGPWLAVVAGALLGLLLGWGLMRFRHRRP